MSIRGFKKSFFAALLFVLIGILIYVFLWGYEFSAFICFGIATVILCYYGIGQVKKKKPTVGKTLFALLTFMISIGLVAATVTGFYIAKAAAGSADTDCEYIIVLGAGVNGTVPSLSLKERLDATYDYLVQHPDVICIVSGGQGEGEDISEAACMFNNLTGRGIPAERIWQEDKAVNTQENLSNSLAIIEEHDGKRPAKVGIVTSEYHLYRANLFAENLGLETVGIPAKTTWITLRINYFLREIIAVWYYSI